MIWFKVQANFFANDRMCLIRFSLYRLVSKSLEVFEKSFYKLAATLSFNELRLKNQQLIKEARHQNIFKIEKKINFLFWNINFLLSDTFLIEQIA